jgi:hypothetical protein
MDSLNSIEKAKGMDPNIQATLDRVDSFRGDWTGRGTGGFPTIDQFEYLERLRIQRSQDAPFLTYEQSTELIDAQGRVIRSSHWEAGILRPREDGSIELACVQGSGRVEVLHGEFLDSESLPGSITLHFRSEMIGNDVRVINSSRVWKLSGDRLCYVMKMATTKVIDSRQHLEADLIRVHL